MRQVSSPVRRGAGRKGQNGPRSQPTQLQSSSSTFSCVSFPSFFAFQEGMWDTQISALPSSPTVSGGLVRQATVNEESRSAIMGHYRGGTTLAQVRRKADRASTAEVASVVAAQRITSSARTEAEWRDLAIAPLAHLRHDNGTGPTLTARPESLSLVRPPVHRNTPR